MAAIYRRCSGAFARVTLGLVVASAAPVQGADRTAPWECAISADGGGWHCTTHDSSDVPSRPLSSILQRQTLPPGVAGGSSGSAIEIPVKLDWVSHETGTAALMAEDQRALLSERCGGGYIDPLADSDQSRDLDEFAIEASAARSEIEGGVATFEGGVIISQGYRRLSSDRAIVDRNEQWAELQENVVLREPGVLLVSDKARVDTESGQSSMDNARFVFHESHMRGGAESVIREDNGDMALAEASLTYCPPDNNNWELSADSIELDAGTGLGTARKATLEVAGIPVLYAPWLRFPMDDRRATGFLWPSIGSDSDGGVDLALPYYINLAPNYDFTVTPRVIAKRGFSGEVEFRHLSETAGMWTLGGAYMPEDDVYDDDYPNEDNDR